MRVLRGLMAGVLLAGVSLSGFAQAGPEKPPAKDTGPQTKQTPTGPSTAGTAATTGVTPPGAATVKPAPPPELRLPVEDQFMFVAFGDLRTTETSNHSATDPERRQAIINAIAEASPKFVLVSGDLVLKGANAEDWAEWDKETKVWADKKIQVVPVLGNHDLNGGVAAALENYFARFPQLQQNRYYSARAGNVMIIGLDSSEPTASGPQFDWLKNKLEHLPKETDFVLFLLHHPPITHSSTWTGGHSTRPSEAALGMWLEKEQETIGAKFVVIAGHVHNYERYERNKVIYIVSGGGGASPYGVRREPGDAYKDEGPSYHYLRIAVNGSVMRIGMEKLEMENGKAVWNERDVVTVTGTAPHGDAKPAHQLPKD